MKFSILISIISLISFYHPVDDEAYHYVDAFSDLAVIEMYRTGIPASITLAQGMHESNYGKSPLALEANNHFGIKCKSYWQGLTYAYKDDDLDEYGNITDSCFRAYHSSYDSYIDHSQFLTNTEHYQSCFKYDKTNYKGWAYELQKCGYATDPLYAEKLINKTEKYQLYLYDTKPNPLIN